MISTLFVSRFMCIHKSCFICNLLSLQIIYENYVLCIKITGKANAGLLLTLELHL